MLSHQEVALFERIRGCGLLGGSVSLGVGSGVSKAHAELSVCFSLPSDQDAAIKYFSSTMPPAILPII